MEEYMEYSMVFVSNKIFILAVTLVGLPIIIYIFAYKRYNIKTILHNLINIFLKVNLKNILFIFLQILSFVMFYILGKTILSNVYLIEWTAHNYYLYIWILVIVLSLFQQKRISFAITTGNFIGIIIGQIWGI
jgi:hypothetical protein